MRRAVFFGDELARPHKLRHHHIIASNMLARARHQRLIFFCTYGGGSSKLSKRALALVGETLQLAS
jgi:hypothetical protein